MRGKPRIAAKPHTIADQLRHGTAHRSDLAEQLDQLATRISRTAGRTAHTLYVDELHTWTGTADEAWADAAVRRLMTKRHRSAARAQEGHRDAPAAPATR